MTPIRLDPVDARIVAELLRDARISNKDLAAAAGVAASTCLQRVRALRERGVLRGFRAEVDPAAVGRGLEALVSVRLRPAARARAGHVLEELLAGAASIAGYQLAGGEDLLVHVAVTGPAELRDLVLERIGGREDVERADASILFGHAHGAGPA